MSDRNRARAWAADDIARDAQCRREARGKTRLVRRYVTEWQEVAVEAALRGDA